MGGRWCEEYSSSYDDGEDDYSEGSSVAEFVAPGARGLRVRRILVPREEGPGLAPSDVPRRRRRRRRTAVPSEQKTLSNGAARAPGVVLASAPPPAAAAAAKPVPAAVPSVAAVPPVTVAPRRPDASPPKFSPPRGARTVVRVPLAEVDLSSSWPVEGGPSAGAVRPVLPGPRPPWAAAFRNAGSDAANVAAAMRGLKRRSAHAADMEAIMPRATSAGRTRAQSDTGGDAPARVLDGPGTARRLVWDPAFFHVQAPRRGVVAVPDSTASPSSDAPRHSSSYLSLAPRAPAGTALVKSATTSGSLPVEADASFGAFFVATARSAIGTIGVPPYRALPEPRPPAEPLFGVLRSTSLGGMGMASTAREMRGSPRRPTRPAHLPPLGAVPFAAGGSGAGAAAAGAASGAAGGSMLSASARAAVDSDRAVQRSLSMTRMPPVATAAAAAAAGGGGVGAGKAHARST